MAQNNTLTLYFIIGFITSILTSCTKPTLVIKGEFKIINQTSYNITFSGSNFQRYNVLAKSSSISTEMIRTSGRAKKITPINFVSPFLIDNNLIVFIGDKCLILKSDEGINNIRDIKNFVPEKLGDAYYKFTYTFTEADYNRAVACL